MIEQEKEYRIVMIKEKDKELDNIYESKGWKKKISKKYGKIYWTNSENQSIWEKDMLIEYDEWIEFYSYKYDHVEGNFRRKLINEKLGNIHIHKDFYH